MLRKIQMPNDNPIESARKKKVITTKTTVPQTPTLIEQQRYLEKLVAKVAISDEGIIKTVDQNARSSARLIERGVQRGILVRLGRGMYVFAQHWQKSFREQRLRIRTLALVKEGNNGVITGAAALALHKSWVKTAGAKILVSGGGQDFGSNESCRRIRSVIYPEHVTHMDGSKVATLAKSAFDEARMRAPRKGQRGDFRAAALAIDGALRRGVRRSELENMPVAYSREHGRSFFLQTLQLCHGQCESPGEVLTKVALLEMGLEFHEQAEVFTPSTNREPPYFLGRVDFFIPELALAVEFG